MGASRNGLGLLQGETRRDLGCAVRSSSIESSQTRLPLILRDNRNSATQIGASRFQ